MNLIEALTALKEGKRIRNKDKNWESTKYIYLDKNGLIKDNNNNVCNVYCKLGNLDNDYWEIVETPILDEQEKKYLESFLRPFIKRYDRIEVVKNGIDPNRFFIEIKFYAFKDGELSDYTNFPYFDKTEHMYEGMKEGKCYTLEELGLFR